MKKLTILSALVLIIISPLAIGAEANSGAEKPAPAAAEADWLAKAKAEYPMKVCVVSGEDFGGDMGDVRDYIYRQDGKPDRLVRFCCAKCVVKFEKDPARYLKVIDEAAAKAPKN